MAEVVVSTLVEQLIATINEQIKSEIHLVRGVDKEILNLSDDLKSLRNVLDDAENRRFQDKNINQWLSRLEQTSYEMEDVLDEWNYALLKLKMAAPADPKNMVCSFIPSPCLCFKKVVVHHDIGTKIKNVKQQLDEILKEKDRFNFIESMPITDRLPGSWRVQSTSMVDSEKVHGRDTDVDFLVSKLLDNGASQGIPILGIVGMGGLGKTTLAQLVYNHSRVEESFDLRIWICVSDPFDPAVIGKCILESVKNGSSPNTNQMDVLFNLVKESIEGKKFLLVLDDVWTEDHNKWEPLENSLRCGGAGSKILVTTRNEGVVKMMGSREGEICRPGVLSDEDCWLLFSRIALSERNEVEFEEIGKKIAKKCNGLPLAVKTLASFLRLKSSLDEWDNVLNSEIWKMEKVEVDIFPHLLLSYTELSPTLKRCFSYCAIFPKDTMINVESLIENWMELGYLGSNIGDMKLRGRECFDILAMRSLFQDFVVDDLDKKIVRCKMHDIVHDFAQFVRKSGRVEVTRMNKTTCQVCDPSFVSNVNQFCSLVWGKKECPPSRLCDCVTRRLRILSMNGCDLRSIPLGLENLIHLRRLDLSGNTVSQENLRIIFQLYFLQTLKLSGCKLEAILKEIGNLIHLRDLDLSENRSLKELPESICGLHELRSLNISWCRSLSRIPEGLAQLTGLGELRGFRGGSCESKLGLLNKLNHLSCLKLIIRLGDEEVVEDAREAELKKKIHLERLYIKFEDEMDDQSEGVRMDVIDALQPHLKLKQLSIEYYKGSKLPLSWIVSPLNQLRSIALLGCSQLSSLPPLGNLPCLEEIYIWAILGLERVGGELLGGSSNTAAFPKLKKLEFVSCLEWKEWEELPESICGLHELRSLDISLCTSLSRIPQGLAQLTGLGELRGFRGGSGESKLGLLNKLNHLSRLHLIVRLGDEEVIEDAREAELRKKIHLRELRIEFEDSRMYDQSEGVRMDVIDALEPHLKLKQLFIDNYKGSKLPLSWIVSPLNQLRFITLYQCNELSSLPPLGKLPCLEELVIWGMKGLERVGGELLGGSSSNIIAAFPKLKKLTFSRCWEWKEWEDITGEEEEQYSTIMPCLTELFIVDCPALRKLPRSLLSKAWPLDKLYISDSEELQQHCTDNGVVFTNSYI